MHHLLGPSSMISCSYAWQVNCLGDTDLVQMLSFASLYQIYWLSPCIVLAVEDMTTFSPCSLMPQSSSQICADWAGDLPDTRHRIYAYIPVILIELIRFWPQDPRKTHRHYWVYNSVTKSRGGTLVWACCSLVGLDPFVLLLCFWSSMNCLTQEPKYF